MSAAPGPPPTLLAVAHGTRDPDGVAATEALLARVRTLRPGLRVESCFLDLVRPSLPEALAGLSGEVVLVPLLLGAGYHVRVDLPAALADAPHLRARVARALGPDPLLAVALEERLTRTGWRPGDGPVVLAAAGSTDPSANADTAAMARLLARRLTRRPTVDRPVVPAYLCAAGPSPQQAVEALRAAGHRRVALAGYLLGPGHFARRVAAAGAHWVGGPLGDHEAVARLVVHRYEAGAAAFGKAAGPVAVRVPTGGAGHRPAPPPSGLIGREPRNAPGE
ncbi:sirohydrochlorin chelatase [Kitasatospora sp. MAP5-34]|uniref:sirohydrochlorin chelatase n=1 Tax=Kitasatospora sp. MAP5-34 TaxID=3035102 RepID=UPI00247596A1|nr:sirohydrochlorin chelatase [Kitasatospora sp. MAP5-34]MDH6577536.1 sirohydrochlorin ferrochelatase [Kitasatospora sp. MAP5-34]